jgi:hypothetical protein
MTVHFDNSAAAVRHLVNKGFYRAPLNSWEKQGRDENGTYTIQATLHPVGAKETVRVCFQESEPRARAAA